jgi:hypothetical protein
VTIDQLLYGRDSRVVVGTVGRGVVFSKMAAVADEMDRYSGKIICERRECTELVSPIEAKGRAVIPRQ